MKCPVCGKLMKKVQTTDVNNYIKRKLKCNNCKHKSVTYEFFAEDIPSGFLEPGTRVLIGDNNKDIVPAIYSRSCSNSFYPHIAIDDDGELMGKYVIAINWRAKKL